MGSFKDIKDHFVNFMKRLVGDTDVIRNDEDGATAMLNFGGEKKIPRAVAVELGTALKGADMRAKELSDMSEASIILDGVRREKTPSRRKEKSEAPRVSEEISTSPKTLDDEERIH